MGVQVRGGGNREKRRGPGCVLEVTLAGFAAGLSALRGDREARQNSQLFSWSIGLCGAWAGAQLKPQVTGSLEAQQQTWRKRLEGQSVALKAPAT